MDTKKALIWDLFGVDELNLYPSHSLNNESYNTFIKSNFPYLLKIFCVNNPHIFVLTRDR